MEFYFDGFLYVKRNQMSKILKMKDEKIIERYESPSDLPDKVKIEFDLFKIMTESPEKFFYYQKRPSGIIEITDSIGKSNLRNIIIPSQIDGCEVEVKNFDSTLFNNAESVIFLNSCVYFPSELLRHGGNLRKVILGENMNLKRGDFINQRKLEEITIGQSITEIPSNCFLDCVSLKKINLENIKKIENAAFVNCKKIDVTIPEQIEEIGIKAFYGSGIQTIVLPKSLKKIGNYAFARCKDIEYLYNNSNATLPQETFFDSNMTLITKRDIDR